MEEIGTRKYAVSSEDFPLSITISTENQQECRSLASNTHYFREGIMLAAVPAPFDRNAALKVDSYRIEEPADQLARPLDLIQVFHIWFDDEPEDGQYLIEISNEAETVTFPFDLSKPTINPEIVVLTFRLEA